MTSIQIRDVPDDIRDALAAQAARAGQSLQGYLLSLITGQARLGRNAVLLRRFADRSDGTRTAPGETATDLGEDRAPRG